MFSKILIKLIDQAIVPVVLLLTVRMVSLVIISQMLNIPFSLAEGGFLFNTADQFIAVNSYSIFSMMAALSIGLAYILIKSVVFHSSHISPQTTAKVFSMKLSFFIQNSYDLYSQGIIWLSYSYLVVLGAGILLLLNLLLPWVFYVGLATTIFATIVFIIDIEKEINLEKASEDLGYYEDDVETLVLNFGEDYV